MQTTTPRTDVTRAPVQFVLGPVVVMLVIPAHIMTENGVRMSALSAGEWLLLALLTAALVLLGLAVFQRLRNSRAAALFGVGVAFLCHFSIAAGFFFPMARDAGMTDPGEASLTMSNVGLALGLALVLTFVSRTRRAQVLEGALVVFVAFNMVGIAVGQLRIPPTQTAPIPLATEGNIIVLSFDGVSGSAALELLRSDEVLSEALDGFIVFERAVSTSPATSASIVTSLLGNSDFKVRYKTIEEVWAAEEERLLTNTLARAGFSVTTYGAYSSRAPDATRLTVGSLRGWSALPMLNFALARAFSRHAVIGGETGELLDGAFRTAAGLLDSGAEDPLSKAVASAPTPSWAKDLSVSIRDFDDYVNGLEVVAGAPPAAQFLHFTHTHYPVEFDRHCSYMAMDHQWYAAHQNWEGVLEETRCAFRQYGDFLNRLDQIGALESSLVVLKSDHGKPNGYNAPGSLEEGEINGHPAWGYGRYRPFLAVRPVDGEPGITFSSAPVLLDDLAQSLCIQAGLGSACEDYPGFDLLEEPLDIPAGDPVTFFIVESEASNFEYESHVALTVTRGDDPLASLFETLNSR